jgi:DNA-binding response OmpR family regulator
MYALRAPPPEALTILLVEELGPLCNWLKFNLECAGLLVLQATDYKEALRISAARAGSIDLLLTSMRLPGLSGPVLAFLLRARRPHMAVLYMSKNLAEMMEMPDAREFIASLLPQPFSREILLRRVSVLLSAHA